MFPKTLIGALLASASLAASAVAFDGMQVGQSPTTAVSAQIARIKQAAGDSGVIPVSSTGARAQVVSGIASGAKPLGELGAELVAAASNGGTLSYIRYHVPQRAMKSAIDTIAGRYRGVVFEASGSDETGPSDWFFVSPLDVTWIRSGGGEKLEIVVATHEVMKAILTQDLNNAEWAKIVEDLRTRSMSAGKR